MLTQHDIQVLVAFSLPGVVVGSILCIAFLKSIQHLKLQHLQKDDLPIRHLIKRRENSNEYQRICRVLVAEQESHQNCIESWDDDFRIQCGCFSCCSSATIPLFDTVRHGHTYVTQFITQSISYNIGDDAA